MLTSLFRHGRSLTSATGRSVLWTRLRHGADLHQTATTTAPDRYPELFAALVCLLPPDADILSFGCSTGEELLSLRRLMPMAHIVGVEINPRARRIAARAAAGDPRITVTATLPDGQFDAVLALAVLQREPIRIARHAVRDLGHHYPFARFDAVLAALVDRLRPGGVLAVLHAHYRVEDARAAVQLEALAAGPRLTEPLFDRSSRRYEPAPPSASLFRKCAAIISPSRNS